MKGRRLKDAVTRALAVDTATTALMECEKRVVQVEEGSLANTHVVCGNSCDQCKARLPTT